MKLQHSGKVNGGLAGASHASVHAPVDVPLIGSVHGAQRLPALHVCCASSADCAWMLGKQSERQRPSAGVPVTGAHVGGFQWPALDTMGSGAQKPPLHVASCDCWATGMSDAGTQCAPPHAGAHAGNTLGSMTGGPVYGHVKIVGGSTGLSHASEHAPVAARGSVAVGLKHGAQRSFEAHVARGRRPACAAIAGRHVERQRPSAPAIDVHLGGTLSPPLDVTESGAQKPAFAPLPHDASCDCCDAGTSDAGTQCAPPHAGAHAGKMLGSITGGPV